MTGLGIVLLWIVTGPLFNFSDTWQLIINTGTTIVTFLMVFLIQNTQNREAEVTQLKLDELLRAVSQARTSMVNLEELSEEELERLHEEFRRLHDWESRKNGGGHQGVVENTQLVKEVEHVSDPETS
ncbi:hypothetical protein TFLX_00268 [Thermoflexales bacterium]|nr:hypothetical protein TFLX_00268 [Thermoflexales bacterium]